MANSIYTSNESLGIYLDDISNDVIVIDTSDNRIGVNILEPHYSIDVRDFSDASGIIYTDYLKTGAIISDLTPDIDVCYNLGTQDKKWNEIHANYLEVSGIKIKDASQFILGSGTGGDAIVFPSDISVNGDISCVNLNVDGITVKDASKFTIGSGSGDTNGIEFMANTTISGDLTITGNINSSYINSLLTSNDTTSFHINVMNNSVLNNQDIYSKYKATNVLTDFSNQNVGYNPDSTSNYHNFNVKFIGDTNNIVRSDLLEYNRFDLTSGKFNTGSTSGYASSVDSSGVIFPITDTYNIDASLNLSVTNTSDYDISLDFVLLQNSVVLYSQTINVISLSSSQDILINSQVSRLTMIQDDTVNFAFLPYIEYTNSNNGINSVINGEYVGQQMNNYSLKTFKYSIHSLVRQEWTLSNDIYNTSSTDPTFIYNYNITSNVIDRCQSNTGLPLGLYYDSTTIGIIYRNPPYINWVSELNNDPNTFDTSPSINGTYFDHVKLYTGDNIEVNRNYTYAASKIPINFSNNEYFDVANNEITIKTNSLIGLSIPISIDVDYDFRTNKGWGNYNSSSGILDYNTNFKMFFIIYTNRQYTAGGVDVNDYIKVDIQSTETILKNTWQWGDDFVGVFNYNVDLGMYPEISQGDKISFRILPIIRLAGTSEAAIQRYNDHVGVGTNVLWMETQSYNINEEDRQNRVYGISEAFLTFDASMNTYIKASQPIDLDINVNNFHLNAEKSVDPPLDKNYNITVMNNSVLNNQDIYSKYKATNMLTDFSNQNVGYNPDYNKTFTVVTMGSSYIIPQNSQISVSSTYSGSKANMVDNDTSTQWVGKTSGPESVTIDFGVGETKTVAGLRIIAEDRRLIDFTLEKSSDGSNFDTIQTFSGFSNASNNSDLRTYTFNLSNIHNTRYIKLSNMNSTTYGNVGINDLEILVLDSAFTTDVNYIINDEIQPDISLNIDTPYIFDLTNLSASHPFNIYTDVNSQSLYTGAVIDGSFIYLTIDSATTALYYDCSNHPGMGGLINVINTGYHNFNVKFIGDTNNIVRSDLLEYNRFDLTSGKFNRNSTSGYANSVDLSGVKVGLYGEYYDIDASLNLTVTNTSVYDISLDFVLLQNSVVLYSQTINVDSSLSSQDILITPQLSRLTMFQDDTVNFAFLPYIKVFDNLNRSVNSPLTGELSYQQDQDWSISVSIEDSGFEKQYMLDNDPDTYWKSTSVGPESVTIDFGETKTVFGLRIRAPQTRLTEFTLEKSSDGSNFTTIKQFSGFNQKPSSINHTVINYTFNLSNIHNTRHIKLNNIMSTGNYAVGISELEFLILDTTSNNYLTNTNLQPIDLDINVNSFNLVVSAPDYEELEVGNLLTANNIDVSNIDIKNTLTIASETPTTAGDSLVFDGNKLTWKNAIIDVREYITDVDIILTKIATFENEYSYTKYGRSVAMTPDGKYICITSELGSINVFEIINNNSYQQIGNSIDISNDSYTHINEDGTVIAIGKLNNIVRVYNFVDNVWQQLGEDITPSNWNNLDTKFVIQLSPNGDQIYIGDSNRDSNKGIVYIYDFSMQTQNWVLNNTIVPNTSTSHRFGSDIKLSGVMDNGELRLLVGAKAYNNGTNQGFIKLFESTNGGKTWPNYSSEIKFIQSNASEDHFGQSIAISRNGKVIMSGFREINTNSGKGSLGIYHEDNINGSWSPVYLRESSGGSNLSQQTNQAFGSSAMALNYDGSRIFCSNYYYNSNDLTNNGIVVIFNYDYLNNNTITFVTSYSGTTTNEQLAFSSGNLSCNDSGDRFIVSAYQYSNDTGRAHLFNVTNDSLGSIPVGSIYYQSSGNDAYVLKIKA